jgi:hypothetical protein
MNPRITLLIILVSVVLDAAPVHAEVIGLHHHGEAVRADLAHQQLGHLRDRLFLDLRPAHHPFGKARILRQADQVGMLVRHQADPQPPHDRAEVMAAGAAHGDRADDHQLVEALGVGKFGHRRRRDVAPAEDLGQVHLGDAARRVLRVVIALGVDDQAFQHALHLALDLVEQALEVAGLEEGGDVVVGVETLAGALQSHNVDQPSVRSPAPNQCRPRRQTRPPYSHPEEMRRSRPALREQRTTQSSADEGSYRGEAATGHAPDTRAAAKGFTCFPKKQSRWSGSDGRR